MEDCSKEKVVWSYVAAVIIIILLLFYLKGVFVLGCILLGIKQMLG